jgi:hypothetical protein
MEYTMDYRRKLFALLLGITLGWSPQPAQAETPISTVTLDHAIHFTAPDGNDMVAEAGTYTVQVAGDSHLRLLPQTDQPAIEIQAEPTTHAETISALTALLIAEEGQDDEVHLVLMLPDGQAFDATGTFSRTRSRGTRTALTATQLRTGLVQSTGRLGGVSSQPSVLYSIASTGALKWYRHNGAQTGAGLNAPGAWTGPSEVGSGWQSFTQVMPGGGNVLYGITPDGTLKWYSHDGAKNGTSAWQGAKNVGTGWQQFKQVFSGSEGILYAIAPDGTLKWYRHTGYRDGAATWEGPKTVGTGWHHFKEVFGMGDGVIYAIAGDGKLKWYKHTGFQNGTKAWEGPKDVGTGWQNFKQVFGAGNGIIYAIASDGILKWYKHTGYRDGTFAWEGAKDIGTGWQGFTSVVSLLPLPPAAAVATATPPTETVETSSPGQWVTWNYLSMHHPEIVAQALADVQSRKQPRTSVAGLASEVELNDMLKTNWSAEVSRLNAIREAGMTQAGVTPRGLPSGLSLKDQVTAIPSVKPTLPQALKPIAHDPFPITLPPRNLGSVWAGQQATAVVTFTAPADGYVEGRLNLTATNRHFRIVNAKAYTGVLARGKTLDVSLTIPGGQYQDVVPDPANPPAQISKAGFVAILAKKGQRIDFTVAFEPVALGMTPVGNNEATLELSGATSSEINILSPNAPVTTWTRIVSIRARFEGINFGVIGTLDDTAITVFYDGTPCNRVIPVPAGITFHNAEQQARSISVTGESLAPALHVQPFTVSLAPGERKQVPIPLQIDSCPYNGIEQTGTIKFAYAGVVRRAEFGVTLYPNIHHWENTAKSVGSCDYSWDIFIRPDGTTSFRYSLRNRNLISEMQLDLRFSVLGQKIGGGVLMDGQNTVHTKMNGYTIHSSFVRDNYVRLLSAPAQVRLRCHTPGF